MEAESKAQTILVVEDDPQIRRMVQAMLSAKGYRVVETDGVQAGWHAFQRHKPDLAVLDIALPDGTGTDLCRKIRSHKERFTTPIIMLTAAEKSEEKAEGFEAGADQYLVKPIHPQEFVLWVQALLRRLSYEHSRGGELKAGELVIDAASHRASYRGQELPYLTLKEFDLLYFLVKNRPKVYSRQQLLKTLWETITVDHVVDVHLYNLRKKLPHEIADRIQSIPGKGFRYLE